MDKIIVEGGSRLQGTVTVGGAKNAALPILVSSLLADGPCVYRNVPDLKDIESILLLLKDLGARVEREGDCVQIDPGGVDQVEASYDLVRKMRASILVLGPLVARLKKARVSLPGGCAIGARPIDYHLRGLKRLGAAVALSHGYVEAAADRLIGAEIYFDFPTVTGTENIMMAAALAAGTTVLRNAAREPEIVALADVLNQMGADITGAGSPKMIINGVERLKPAAVSIIPDRIEAGTFMVAAAITGGDVWIENGVPEHLEAVIHKLRLTGARVETEKGIRVIGNGTIDSTDIKTDPYPGFPTDMQAQFMVLMTVSSGLSLITETVFENRFIHVSELRRMGADIKVSGGNAALVTGVPALSGAPVMASDLRASASLILAGLVATGTTEVNRVYHLDRGYEALETKMEKLGAAIRRVS
ncbi:MAG: UDP-N-acetylglucosamine 1-carboxyvinyltransferase [Deltaproteobacteria bacterium]|nr:MAG: UDP-N-acetylglucosamine 1-carboxyvinyltransferase [Deltaproteobacteria bacterium]